MSSIVLHIFTGLHREAEVELTPGSYVLGSDDSCDIILSDSSIQPRHAVLEVSAPVADGTDSSGISLAIQAMDGPVSDNAPDAAHPFTLGRITFAWAEPANAAAAWETAAAHIAQADPSHAAETMQTNATKDDLPPEDQPQEQNTGSKTGESPVQSEDPEIQVGKDAEALLPEAAPLRSNKRKKLLLATAPVLTALLLAAPLYLTFNGAGTPPAHEESVRSLLNEAGYTTLEVSGQDDAVTISGRVATDRERGRLLDIARLLDFPVILDVRVRSDAASAVEASFNAQGLHPEVSELPPASPHPGISAKGYVRDGVLEEKARAEAVRNVPALRVPGKNGRPLELYCTFKHQDDVAAALGPLLASSGLSSVTADYQPGRIFIRGSFDPAARARLGNILTDVQASLGVPVPFHVVNELDLPQQGAAPSMNAPVAQNSRPAPEQHEAEAPATAPAATSAAGSGRPSFQVSSVSMGAMKFITLKNGERVFTGGELPGGFILEDIAVDKLTLSKNNQQIIHPVKGGKQ